MFLGLHESIQLMLRVSELRVPARFKGTFAGVCSTLSAYTCLSNGGGDDHGGRPTSADSACDDGQGPNIQPLHVLKNRRADDNHQHQPWEVNDDERFGNGPGSGNGGLFRDERECERDLHRPTHPPVVCT